MERLTVGGRQALLAIARRSLEEHLQLRDLSELAVEQLELQEPAAAFVTLTRRGELRGCVGVTEADQPLYRTVARCAVAAATADSRFPPVEREELSEIRLSISVLSPFCRMDGPEQVQVGAHGLMIRRRERRGLLLPQVAAERGWDAATFLRETCRKAGLAADDWRKPDAEVFLFEAEYFSETW